MRITVCTGRMRPGDCGTLASGMRAAMAWEAYLKAMMAVAVETGMSGKKAIMMDIDTAGVKAIDGADQDGLQTVLVGTLTGATGRVVREPGGRTTTEEPVEVHGRVPGAVTGRIWVIEGRQVEEKEMDIKIKPVNEKVAVMVDVTAESTEETVEKTSFRRGTERAYH